MKKKKGKKKALLKIGTAESSKAHVLPETSTELSWWLSSMNRFNIVNPTLRCFTIKTKISGLL